MKTKTLICIAIALLCSLKSFSRFVAISDINNSVDSTAVAQANLVLSMISSPELDCSDSPFYEVYLTVTGGTPPYKYKWTADSNTDISNSCDTCPDLLNIDFLYWYPEGMTVKCVVEDSLGIIDSLEYYFTPDYPPDVSYGYTDNPICPGVNTGAIYMWSSVMSPSGPYVHITEDGLSAGTYTFTQPYGYGCTQVWEITLENTYADCDTAFSIAVTNPDCGQCNGEVNVIPHFNNGNNFSYNYYYANDVTGDPGYEHQLCDDSTYTAVLVVTSYGGDFELYKMFTVNTASCTPVYPGDANNDGIANNIDLLSIGLAFNDTGSVRVDTTITWNGKYVSDWANVFADSTNHKHADCDGNGMVNDGDTTAIILNFGLTHNRPSQNNIAGAPYLTVDLPATVLPSALVYADVIAGDATLQCNNLYGAAFTVNYDPSRIDQNSMQFIPDSSWYGSANDFLTIQKSNLTSGVFYAAITRKDHHHQSGYGKIGKLIFQMLPGADTVITSISINQIYAIDNAGSAVLLNGGSDSTTLMGICILNASIQSTNSCAGVCAGSATVNATGANGPLTYDWSLSVYDTSLCIVANVNPLVGISTGDYRCIVTDSAGCIDTTYFIGVASSGLNVMYNVNYESCTVCDGSVDLTVLSGVPPYSFLWGDNSTSEDLLNLCNYYDSYMCTITDSLGCQFFVDYQSPNCYPQNAFTTHDADCPYSDNGAIEFGAIGPQFVGCDYYGEFINPLCGIQGWDIIGKHYFVHYACPGVYTFMQISRMGCDTTYENIALGYLDAPVNSVVITYPTCTNCNGSILALDNGDTLDITHQSLDWTVNGISLPVDPVVLTGLCQGDSIYYIMDSGVSACYATGTVYIDSCLVPSQIIGIENSNSISIHPNPNDGNFIINGIANYYPGVIEILRSDGKLIHKESVTMHNAKSISIKASSGVYICRIISDKGVVQLRFIVN